MNLEDLKKPFQPHEHKFNYEGWAYIDEDAISNRLDDVCGMGNWKLEHISEHEHTQTHWSLTVNLAIKVGDEWVGRAGTGEGTTSINKDRTDNNGKVTYEPLADPRYTTNMGENAKKGAATDAFRRAARLWGIGRYLLNLPKKSNGKPEVTDETELRKWLVANYAKMNEPPPSASPQPQHEETFAHAHLHGKTLDITRIERKKEDYANNEKVWHGYFDYDDDPMIKFCMIYDNHLRDIDEMLGYSHGSMKAKLANEPINFPAKLALKMMVDPKGRVKPANLDEQDLTFKNPMILRAFLIGYPNYSDLELAGYLGVPSLEDYDKDINTAKVAVRQATDPDFTPGKLHDTQSVYTRSQGTAKQKQMAGMPSVAEDLV